MLNYSIGDGYSALDAQAWRDKLDGFAVVSGLGVSPGTGLEVSVASGTALVGSSDTVTLGSSTAVALDTADADNPRKDTIWIDDTGTVGKTTGVAEPADPSGNIRENTYQPEPPHPTGDVTILAWVWVAAGASSLATADVIDRRVPASAVFGDVAATSATIDGTISHDALTSLHLSADQTITTGTWTQIAWDATSDEELSGFDATANSFVAPEAGRYALTVTAMFGTWDPAVFALRVRVNGTNVGEAWYQPQQTSGFTSEQVAVTVSVAAGDEIDTHIQQQTGVDQTLDSTNVRTWCDITKVG